MKIWKLVATATVLITSTSANAALIERLGGLAYYDDQADLTWLADANYAMTSGADADGRMIWFNANEWVSSLSINGVTGWRLPGTLQPDASCDGQSIDQSNGYNCSGSEMGNLFYNVLGNSTGFLSNTGPFSNVQSGRYWSETEYNPDPYAAWHFNMGTGLQSLLTKNTYSRAWAVQSGDVGAVPVPAAAWLFGSGLLGLVAVARRKNNR